MMMDGTDVFSLHGRFGMITGAASGMGRATAELLSAQGAGLVLFDRDPAVESVAHACRSLPGHPQIHTLLGDAGTEEDVRGAIAIAERQWGRLDFLICCAARFDSWADPLETSVELWSDVLRVNLIGPYLALRHAVPLMRDRGGGSIVLIASVGGMRAGGGGFAYSASKAGVINLVQTSAHALSGSGIRVNAISPGLILTPMSQPIFDHAAAAGSPVGQLNPMRRAGSAGEIASVAAFLASDASGYVNGQNLAVDGGLSGVLPFRLPS